MKEPKDRREVSLIASIYKRQITRRDEELEILKRYARGEGEELSRNPLEVAEFVALYTILIFSPLVIMLLNSGWGADSTRRGIMAVSVGFSVFGFFMALVAPAGQKNVFKELFRLRGGISEVSKKFLVATKHSEYKIFKMVISLLAAVAINQFLLGFMPGRYDVCNAITMPVTIGILLILNKYLGAYLPSLYGIIDALPLNLQLFCIFLIAAVVSLPFYAPGLVSEGWEIGGIAMGATAELFFISLFLSCIGIAIELILFLGIRNGLVGTLSSVFLLGLTYIISTSIVPIIGLGTPGVGGWYQPVYLGGSVVSSFLGFYRTNKRAYEWYASLIYLVSSVILITSSVIQQISILAMVFLLITLSVYDTRKTRRFSPQSTR